MGKYRPVVAAAMAALWVDTVYRSFLRPEMYTWGATVDEIAAVLPGDELIAGDAALRTTRAVTIPATVGEVWPWLIQIGENRAGFYSYSLLENLVGADIHNAREIHPEWQDVRAGDTVWLASKYGPDARQIVADIKVNSHLVLVSPGDYERMASGEPVNGCWAFVLHADRGATRLIVRSTGGSTGRFWFDIPHFVMEQKMLRGIRERVLREQSTTSLCRVAAIAHG